MYILIDGVDTREYGLRVSTLPPIQIAQKRVDLIPIPGRSGFLTQWSGAYEEVVKIASFFYRGLYPHEIAKIILEGKTITFSNEPDKVYDYRMDNVNDLVNTISTWHQFDIPFTCHPIKRATNPTQITADTPPVILISPCNHLAYPTITLTGSGNATLTVGNQTVSLEDIFPSITIDGDLMECYQGDTRANSKMTGDFPAINPGETVSIGWSGGVTKVEISPNWRWV
jgi:phage-related protein